MEDLHACATIDNSNIVIKIVNVVASTKINHKLNLNQLINCFNNAEYEPEIFPGLVYRRNNPKATMIMFSTGKLVSVGTTSKKLATNSIHETVKEIETINGQRTSIEPINIVNVVAVANTNDKINIMKSLMRLKNVIYEPDQFPGIIYRLKDSIVLLIFNSGKIVCVGAKSEIEAMSSLQKVYRMIL